MSKLLLTIMNGCDCTAEEAKREWNASIKMARENFAAGDELAELVEEVKSDLGIYEADFDESIACRIAGV